MMNKIIVFIIALFSMFASASITNAQTTENLSNKEIVAKALDALFVQRDTTVITQYFAEDYIQHNPFFPSGRDVLYGLVANMSPDFTFEPGLMMEDGDFVMVHSRYSGIGPKPMIIVDIYRVIDGIITQHWDIAQEEVPAEETVSKNPMFPIE